MRIVIKSKTGKDQMNQLKYLLLLFLLLCLPLSFIASVQAFQVTARRAHRHHPPRGQLRLHR